MPVNTPPLTPDVDSESSSISSSLSSLADVDITPDAPEFFSQLFPKAGFRASVFAKGVVISEVGARFEGFVLDLPKEKGLNNLNLPRTLYVNSKGAENVALRESIVAMLDLADEHLACEALVIALDKSSPNFGGLVHALMYVGGTPVTKPPFEVDPGYVLVGLDI
ncbi:hypothetical protein SISNIDRAFT_540803 [Sistotremastrum niveocremeum HHB9708]|nr:hypothetical protein SISNIDRAFT_540803 [Sistotremastrum niveocremeum HHB9708]